MNRQRSLWNSFKIEKPRHRRRATRLRLERLEDRRVLATIWVATTGDDGGAGTAADPFLTIQRAVDEADESVTPGADTINVRAGTYVETVDIDDADPLTIKGLGAVTIDGDGDGTVVDIFGGDVSLINLEITGGGAVDVGLPSEEFGDGIDFIASTSGVVAGTSLLLDNVNVHDNDPITGPEFGWGVYTEGVESVQIKRSEFRDNTVGIGITLGDSLDVSYTTTESNREEGVFTTEVATQNYLVVTANDNGDGPDPGEGFELDGDEITMRQVTASGNTLSGLRVDPTGSLSVNTGTFEDNGFNGVEINEVDEASLSVVRAHGNSNDGIQVFGDGGTVTVHNAKANENMDDGFDAFDLDSVSVSFSEFIDNDNEGLNVNLSEDVLVDQVLAAMNGDDGIDIDDSEDVVVRNSRANNNIDDGFDFDDDDEITLTNLVGTGNDAGVSVIEAGDVEISNSRFFNNRVGVDIFLALTATLNNVGATNNTEDGLLIEGDTGNGLFTEVEISRGLYMQNGVDGINIFDVGDVLVSGVSLIFNGDDGLDVSLAGVVTQERILALYNGDEDIIIT